MRWSVGSARWISDARPDAVASRQGTPGTARSVALVVGGTAAAQLVTVAVTPVLTRIYGPDALGAFASVLAYTGVIGPVAGLCLPIAIVLAPASDVAALARASRLVAAVVAVVAAACVPLFLQGVHRAGVSWSVLAAVVGILVLTAVSAQVVQHELMRERHFALLGTLAVGQAVIFAGLQLLGGALRADASTLVMVSVTYWAGYLVVARSMPTYRRVRMRGGRVRTRLKAIMSRYSDFPRYRAPQVMVNAIGVHAPTLVLGSVVGIQWAAFYLITYRILAAPVQLVGKAISDVLYPQVTALVQTGSSAAALLLRWTLVALGVAIAVAAVVLVGGESAFVLVLGDGWEEVAVLAMALIPWLLGALLCRPAVGAVPALGLQRTYLVTDTVVTSVKTLALCTMLLMGSPVWLALLIWAIISGLGSGLITVLAIRRARAPRPLSY